MPPAAAAAALPLPPSLVLDRSSVHTRPRLPVVPDRPPVYTHPRPPMLTPADIESTIATSATWGAGATSKAFPTTFLTSPEFSSQTVSNNCTQCTNHSSGIIDADLLRCPPQLDCRGLASTRRLPGSVDPSQAPARRAAASGGLQRCMCAPGVRGRCTRATWTA